MDSELPVFEESCEGFAESEGMPLRSLRRVSSNTRQNCLEPAKGVRERPEIGAFAEFGVQTSAQRASYKKEIKQAEKYYEKMHRQTEL